MVICMEIRHILYRIGLAIAVPVLPISDAVHCNRSCSALQPSSQCTASSMLVLATFPASTCIRPRKYVHPSPQVRATVPASTCIRPCKYVQPSLQVRASVLASTDNVCNRGCKRYKPLPQTFAGKCAHLGMIRHHVVSSPGHILNAAGKSDRCYLAILSEDLCRVNSKGD